MDHPARIASLRAALGARGADAYITTHLPNVRYLSGFTGSNALLLVTAERTWFLTDFRYRAQTAAEVTADRAFFGQGSLIELARVNGLFRHTRAVSYDRSRLTVAQYDELGRAAGFDRLVGQENVVEELRHVKDADELELVQRAAAVTDAVFARLLPMIRPGVRECDIAAEIARMHRRGGAEKDAFDTITASGPRSALPHGRATERVIGMREFVTLDFGCVVEGYHSDMTRTVCVGNPTAEMKKVYGIVLEAQRRGTEAVKTGVPARTADAAAREHITSKGYGEYFGHSLGHGVGLEIHESLRLSAASGATLRNGHLVTVEPGIYLPGKFGVRIEDMVVVRDGGAEVLTASPKELIVL